MNNDSVIIIGAGPAGLTSAHELLNRGICPRILEKEEVVGGMARTVVHKGYRFDVGGHRFVTGIEEIQKLWELILGDDLLLVQRLSRIYYQKRFFRYPLNFTDIFTTLGLFESFLALSSYIKSRIYPSREEKSFEQWISNRFGKYLYRTFFETYTEKVWGIPGSKISSEWAKQRIKGLSLSSIFLNSLVGYRKSKTLTGEFFYPVEGPGMMWEGFKSAVLQQGGKINLNSEVVSLNHVNGRIVDIIFTQNGNEETKIPVNQVISSMPVNHLISRLNPRPPDDLLEVANSLKYRAFVLVGLIIGKENLSPDQWLYIQDPGIRVGRIQNFKNWSPGMAPNPKMTNLGMEYFCTEGDELWSKPDEDLINLAALELSVLGIARQEDIIHGFVIRQPYAYPVYDEEHDKKLGLIRGFLDKIGNLQTIGRNGMHRYNNMDHSMYIGLLAARNLSGEKHNLWNYEETYPDVDRNDKAIKRELEETFIKTFARLDTIAFATAVGFVSGLFFFLLTIWLIIKGGEIIGPNLQLLGQYFIGYTVTLTGAFIALGYGFIWGFIFGGLLSFLRNFFLSYHVYRLKKKAEMLSIRDFFDQL